MKNPATGVPYFHLPALGWGNGWATGNVLRFKFACSGDPATSGEGEYTFTSDKAYSGRMTINTVAKGKPERMQMTQTGRWLSADCGSLAPAKR